MSRNITTDALDALTPDQGDVAIVQAAVDELSQMPQPYPSWSWVDGEGWVAPKPKPEGDYYWDEDAGEWVEEDEI